MEKTRQTAVVFIISVFIGLMALLAVMLAEKGSYWEYFFWKDTADTGMDFYNSLAESAGGDPYGTYHTLYPPLGNAYFYGMHLMIPEEVRDSFPTDHDGIVAMRRTEQDLRTAQSAYMLYIAQLLTYTLGMMCVIAYKLRDRGFMSVLSGAAAVLTYGSLTAIERGNIISLAAMLTMVFLFGYDSRRRSVHILSCIALSIAAALKLYPAIYGIFLLSDRRYKAAISTALTGITLTIAPLYLFGGLRDLRIFLTELAGFNTDTGEAIYYRYGMRGIVEHISDHLYKRTGLTIPAQDRVSLILLIIVSAVLTAAFFIHRDCCKKAFDITVILILLQPKSTDYTLCFFIPVIILMIYEAPVFRREDLVYFIMLLILTVPYPTGRINDRVSLILHHVDIVQSVLGIAVMYEFLVVCRHLLRKRG
ncbi:MAG: DUF2029 domain-containing protein [Lachnospiraceae bacterium]|nr:DUF2029 domain-containing protein [Lachnospiraceae bacterium]